MKLLPHPICFVLYIVFSLFHTQPMQSACEQIGGAPVSPPSLSPVLSGQLANFCAQLTAQYWEPQGPKQVSTFLPSQRS